MSKKSYMDSKNILNESFFDKVRKFFGLNLEKHLKGDKEFRRSLKGLNKSIKDFEKYSNKTYGGKKLKLSKFNLLDFM